MNKIKKIVSFESYLKILKLFGIDVGQNPTTQSRRTEIIVARIVIKAIWIVLIVMNISNIYFSMYSGAPSFNENKKQFIVAMCMSMCSSMAWWYLLRYETKLSKALKKLLRIADLLEISQPQRFIILFSICLMLSCIFVIFSYDSIIKLYDLDEMFSASTFDVLDSTHINSHFKLILIHLHYITKGFLILFNVSFVGFYVIVCCYMKLILNKHSHLNATTLKAELVSSENIDVCVWRYNAILSTFQVINSILCFPIFLSSSTNACAILWSFTYIIKKGFTGFVIGYILLINFFMFTAVSFAASAVNEADKMIKNSDKKLLCMLIMQDKHNLAANIRILRRMATETPFCVEFLRIYKRALSDCHWNIYYIFFTYNTALKPMKHAPCEA